MRKSDTETAFENFRTRLKAYGVREALVCLLGLTDYHYIGLWRFQEGRANAAVHIDRESPAALTAVEVADTATYCCYVRDRRGVFMTAHAMLDPSTAGHPARAAVPAYCGVPVMDAEGQILATLCHYDVVPRDPAQIDLELMLRVASLLAQSDYVPPYPSACAPILAA